MNAAILAIGSELLGATALDTNSLRFAVEFERFGVTLIGKSVVGDDEGMIANALQSWIHYSNLIVVTGGLGPTADDVTRTAVAAALGRSLETDHHVEEKLRRRFESFGRKMPEVNRRQAQMIEGAEVLQNDKGTAPGMRIEHNQTTIFLFPGVPSEVDAMVERYLRPWLSQHASQQHPGICIERAVFKIACVPESEVEQRIAPLYEQFGREGITVLSSPGAVLIHLKVVGSEEACRAKLKAMRRVISTILGDAIYSEHQNVNLEHVIGELLRSQRNTLVTAESCTGGLLAERITSVPGSSDYFLGGVMAYADVMKTKLLGVHRDLLQAYGAVSEPVATAMAQGVRSRYGSDYGISITGVAGPDGGTAAKPVGTVHIALAGPGDMDIQHQARRFSGDRHHIRWQSSQWALEMLRQNLLPAAHTSPSDDPSRWEDPPLRRRTS